MAEFDDPGLSALYRRAPRPEPSARSDRLILAAAHRALRRPRLPHPAWALAATLVLGVGIGWQMLTDTPESLAPASAVDPAPGPKSVPRQKHEVAPAGPVPAVPPRQPGVRRDADSPAPAARIGPAPTSEFTRREAAGGVSDASECEPAWLADDAPRDAWLGAIERARRAGDPAAADCLLSRYRRLFGDQ